MNYWIFWQCTFHFSTWHPTIAPNWLQMTVVPIFHLDLLFIVISSYSTSFKLNVEWIELKWIDQYLIDQLTTKIANWCNSQVVKPVHPQKLQIWGMIREILIFQFSHLLLKRIIRIQELGKEDTGSESQISDVQASCSYFLSTTGQPRKEPQIPTSGSLRKSPSWWWGEEGWVEEWRRDSWRGRKARTMWERLAGWGVGSAGRFSSFLMENLDPVSLRESSRERGNPFFSLSISWKARSLLILLPLPPRLRLRGVWVQASLAVASQLKSSSSTLQTASISSSLSVTGSNTSFSSSGSSNLTNLVEVHVEHHSTRLGQLEEVSNSGSFFRDNLRRWISSGLWNIALAAISSSSPYLSSQDLLHWSVPSGGSLFHWWRWPMTLPLTFTGQGDTSRVACPSHLLENIWRMWNQ